MIVQSDNDNDDDDDEEEVEKKINKKMYVVTALIAARFCWIAAAILFSVDYFLFFSHFTLS